MSERDSRSRKARTGPGSVITCCLAAFVAGLSGCASDGDAPVNNTIHLELDFGSGVTLSSVIFQMSGPNGFHRVGSLTVGDQPSVTTTFTNLPVGMGYDIRVMGTASDDASGCRGEAMFDVSASMTAMLTIPLNCTGIAAVSTTVNVCPVIDELSALPAQVAVGGSITLIAAAHDADNGPSPLSATWTAPDGGTLSNQSTTGATFTCTSVGTFTIGVSVSDGQTDSNCPDFTSVTVTCGAPSAALERAVAPRGGTV
jgi:hypothetical protein